MRWASVCLLNRWFREDINLSSEVHIKKTLDDFPDPAFLVRQTNVTSSTEPRIHRVFSTRRN
ncbi:hypothetical protein PsorP6_003261 [Peronosclerospora sorghi]|uniref:Uncharacterized protein n=1 Tax=Peronosclerospora sorghi TaxID=230839 RepID=A0ACC0VPH8_9STRA|nr:hypothetical protein PsorP6_003261 [Peronosclerospora sorghi]